VLIQNASLCWWERPTRSTEESFRSNALIFFWQVHDDNSMIPSARGVKQTPAHHTTAKSKLARNRLPVVVTDRSMGTHFNLRPRAAAAAASPAETFVSNEAASTDRNCLYRPMSRHPNLSRTP
jgi:hypothetical protein